MRILFFVWSLTVVNAVCFRNDCMWIEFVGLLRRKSCYWTASFGWLRSMKEWKVWWEWKWKILPQEAHLVCPVERLTIWCGWGDTWHELYISGSSCLYQRVQHVPRKCACSLQQTFRLEKRKRTEKKKWDWETCQFSRCPSFILEQKAAHDEFQLP